MRREPTSHGWSLEGIEIVELIADEDDLDGEAADDDVSPVGGGTERDDEQSPVRQSSGSTRRGLFLIRFRSCGCWRKVRCAIVGKSWRSSSFLSGVKCTVLLLDDRTSEGSDLQLQSIAHGVISLEQLAPVYGAARRRLRVEEISRDAVSAAGYHDFCIEPGGLAIFPRLVASEHSEPFPSETHSQRGHGS